MKQKGLYLKSAFAVVFGNARSQAAEMVLAPGKTEGGADQWLFVVSGRGEAVVNGKKLALKKWNLVLIERGDTHEIRNTGRTPLRTLNFYVPPGYNAEGDELPAGKP